MGVRVIQGNLLEAAEDLIGHQVNCQSVMGSGVARSLKEQYPTLFNAFLEFCQGKTPESLLGQVQTVETGGKVIANLFGQLHYGRSKKVYTDYRALGQALSTLKTYAQERSLSVALPYYIGCGLANGDWTIVSKLIDDAFSDYEVVLYKL
ncbi:Appr-1-p processing protein [Paenibacillus filicis]|uniref:Appr-1-p processing protein n=1 Tax=Paenibacillus filicis TaxID=669464 RepID=A0ABU9DET8_9BACL